MTIRKITYINDNDPVSASVTNKPLKQLQQETEFLQTQFDTTEAGNTLMYREIPCDSSVEIGMPVYWDNEEQCCKPAYISTELNNTTQEYETGNPSDCIGLVYTKKSAYSADILVNGIVDFKALSPYLKGAIGRFYLGNLPGTLTCTPCCQAFPLGVVLGPLGPCDDSYRVYFNPCYANSLLQHQHFKIDLATVEYRPNSFDEVDEGWQEVQTADEEAPVDAKYVYRMGTGELSKFWPPVPISAISATIDWADNTENIGGKELTINKPSSLLYINESGIYWMSDDIVPFGVTSEGYRQFRITLHFSKVRYAMRNEFVTSIQPDTNQPFKFVNCSGQESRAGDVYIQFILKDNEVESTNYDGRSLKCFTDDWKSEMVPTVNGIRVTGNALIPIETPHFTVDGNTYYKGLIDLNLSPFAPDTEISPQIVKVDAAQEREVYGITYLGLPAGRDSSLRLKFEIPGNYATVPLSFKLRMQCIATITSSQYADATINYILVKRATTPQSLTGLTITPPEIPCDFTEAVTKATMFEIESEEITVDSGDTLIVIISRENSTAYNADLAIARIQGILNIKQEEDNAA